MLHSHISNTQCWEYSSLSSLSLFCLNIHKMLMSKTHILNRNNTKKYCTHMHVHLVLLYVVLVPYLTLLNWNMNTVKTKQSNTMLLQVQFEQYIISVQVTLLHFTQLNVWHISIIDSFECSSFLFWPLILWRPFPKRLPHWGVSIQTKQTFPELLGEDS